VAVLEALYHWSSGFGALKEVAEEQRRCPFERFFSAIGNLPHLGERLYPEVPSGAGVSEVLARMLLTQAQGTSDRIYTRATRAASLFIPQSYTS